jgi:hypothetical protein
MIVYADSLFGFHLIFRVHGSAVWKACVPALISSIGMLLYDYIYGHGESLEVGNTGSFLRKLLLFHRSVHSVMGMAIL